MARIGKWLRFGRRPSISFRLLFARFRAILDNNTRVLQLFADLAEKQSGEYVFDRSYIQTSIHQLFDLVGKTVHDLNSLTDQKHTALYAVLDRLRDEIQGDVAGRPVVSKASFCVPFAQIDESLVNLVGGKSAHLGELHTRLHVRIPDGFTITTWAFVRIIEANHLSNVIEDGLLRLSRGDDAAVLEIAERLLHARVPREIGTAIRKAVAALGRTDQLSLAVRSSALGEDQDLSFAGQYETVLHTKPAEVIDAYRRVLASLYAPHAVAYRTSSGLPAGGLMAVACMRMVRATVSGVLYTVDPNRSGSGELLLGATRGLANRAVQGEQNMAQYSVARQPPHEVLGYRPAAGVGDAAWHAEGDQTPKPPGDGSAGRELADADVRELSEMALRIERYFKQPQDIEWARDADGSLYLIQARRLRISAPASEPRDLSEILNAYPVLLRRRGQVACRGVASGPVVHVTEESDLAAFPAGGVLVSRRASPRFVSAMAKCAAIVTDIGAPTGHMAALAREFRVPTLVDCATASIVLTEGQVVTVDADENAVYAGRVDPLIDYQLVTESGLEDTPEYRLLRRLLRRITPLNLIDHHADNFRADRCRTIHDVIRFAHETAVDELIDLQASGRVSGVESAKRLISDLPIGLSIIDVGGGLDTAVGGGLPQLTVTPAAIRSVPMLAIWAGLTTPGVWSTRPVRVDLATFFSSAMSGGALQNTHRNLAVVSENYVNLSLNVGYHFTMVDAFVSGNREENHIYFRFVGGASDAERRTRRAEMVRDIMERLGFATRQSYDLVVARLRKLPRTATEERLRIIGRLIGFTRQIDALMDDEDTVSRYTEAFFEGRHNPE
ncbi:MAG: PEP-utilizing enzyme [Acidobacteria bacterium]|nr:PEP-utilizing enzyme [Acidobacteriota bacterium]